MTYIDEYGNRYTIAREGGYGWFVLQTYDTAQSRFKGVVGSKDFGKITDRLNKYACDNGWIHYPDVICSTCAQASGKIWPEGHLATFYAAPCDICKEVVTVTQPRDWGHWKSAAELKALYRIAKGGKS
jgi:hypothetical protein